METIIKEEGFGSALGRDARLYTMESGGFSASFCDLGCTLVRFCDPHGRDIVLGYDSAEGYLRGSSYIGATVGRYAGRIGGAGFELCGKEFELSRNDGQNHLHGGFGKRYFEVSRSGGGLVFTLTSPEGDEGFPGELTLRVTVTLNGGRLRMEYRAVSSAPTHINITNHSYFNLGGPLSGHSLRVCGRRYLETDGGLIPTGRALNVRGTALDFHEAAPLAPALCSPALASTRGLDHSFLIPGRGLRTAAELSLPGGGLRLICRTTQPTLHVYTAGYLDDDACGLGKGGEPLARHGGVCFEAQHAPNSPNIPRFPATRLDPGQEFLEITEYELTGGKPVVHASFPPSPTINAD